MRPLFSDYHGQELADLPSRRRRWTPTGPSIRNARSTAPLDADGSKRPQLARIALRASVGAIIAFVIVVLGVQLPFGWL